MIFLLAYLHANDSIDEEQHDDEEGDVGQCLEGLDECPQQRPDALAPTQEFHQSHDTEESEKVYRNDARRLRNAAGVFRLINLRVNDVDETSEHNYEVEDIPGVPEIVFEAKSGKLEDKLECEDGRENHVENVEGVGVEVGLSVKLHRQRDCVYHNKNEDCVFEWL